MAPTREKADDRLPDHEVPLAAEGVRSGPSPRWWCLNPDDHGPDLIHSRCSLPLTMSTAHGNRRVNADVRALPHRFLTASHVTPCSLRARYTLMLRHHGMSCQTMSCTICLRTVGCTPSVPHIRTGHLPSPSTLSWLHGGERGEPSAEPRSLGMAAGWPQSGFGRGWERESACRQAGGAGPSSPAAPAGRFSAFSNPLHGRRGSTCKTNL